MIKNLLTIAALTSALIIPLHAANIVVVAPNANTTTSGSTGTGAVFQTEDFTFQWLLDAGQFSAVPIGSQVTSIGFRVIAGSRSTPDASVTFPHWNLQLSSSEFAVGSLGSAFSSNISLDVVSVYSGPLTIPARSFQNLGSSQPFFFILLTTPYTYMGNNLLATLSMEGAANDIYLDAVGVDGVGDTVGAAEFNAIEGTSQFFNYPVTAYVFSTPSQVPEPSACVLFGSGLLGLVALTQRRRR